MLSDIEASSKALLKLGLNAIQSFDEGTAEAEIAAGLYPSVRDALLSAHPWSFSTGQITLTRLTAAPVADFEYAYQLPPDFLRAISLGRSENVGRGAEYRILERRIHTNADPAVLSYIFRADEATTPPFFDDVLVTKLAAEFCAPLTESNSRTDALLAYAEKGLSRARLIDSQQQTPVKFEDFTLIDARLS